MKFTNNYILSACVILTATLTTFTSCNKYLDVKPTKGTGIVISTASDLTALLENYNSFYAENNRTAIYSSDDFSISKDLFDANPNAFSTEAIQFMLWDKQYIPTDYSEYFWGGEYSKILTANLVLNNVAKVSGSAKEKTDLTDDAHFIRAYSYFQLVNTYCLPYSDANKNEPGLPIKLMPNYEENVARQSLSATYQQIESDLTEALKTTVVLTQGGVNHNWRASIEGVKGFAARFYLTKGDYVNALKYANESLAAYSQLVDYNTEMRYGIPSTVQTNGGINVTITFPYTHDKSTDFTDMLGWKEFLYFRMLSYSSPYQYNALNWYIPSQDLLNLYDKTNDLRYKYHMVQNYSYTKGVTNPAYSYPGYVFFYADRIPSGPTVAEMYLIRAESLARTGDMTGAMTAVNTLHSKRMATGSPALTASSQDQAITVILQERRREMPFSQRWFDIRRLNSNNYAADNVPATTRTFYPYGPYGTDQSQPVQIFSLPANSRRFAQPIPQNDITNSNGAIIQNTY